jgi:glycosyltransferase involved in cell wall biosynthesis/nucleotide-binding universal stress UspA family protein
MTGGKELATNRIYFSSPFRKILVPICYGHEESTSLSVARLFTDINCILLIGFVCVPEDQPLSVATNDVQEMRKYLRAASQENGNKVRVQVRVTYSIWENLLAVIDKEQPDLLVADFKCFTEGLGKDPAMMLMKAPCNIAVVKGPVPTTPRKIIIPVRGGPYAELALRIALGISRRHASELTVLHIRHKSIPDLVDASFKGLARVVKNLPEIKWQQVESDYPVETIQEMGKDFDLILMGVSAQTPVKQPKLGIVAEQLFRNSPAGVIAVKSKQDAPVDFTAETAGQSAISILVDKWFAENTYHADEFQNIRTLYQLKQEQGVTISLAMPALNEEKTIGNVIQRAKSVLMDQTPLLDEIIVVDSNSSDRTREIASQMGVPVYIHQNTLPETGARKGKGEALWKSLYLTKGDIVVWVDTDIVNFHPRFVYGLIGPLLIDPRLKFIKGFYRRPIKVGDRYQAGGGGRVTELTARPLINLFYPELSGVIQPLSGEYGGRRIALEQLPFFSGYGVEIGLLIEAFESFGLGSIAQVDLLERIHHNQSLEALSKMSFAIIQAVMLKLEKRQKRGLLDDVNKTMKLIRYESRRFFIEVEEIAENERPPMITNVEYQERRKA